MSLKCSLSSKTLAKSPGSNRIATDQSQPLYRLSQILIFVLLLTLRLYNFEFVFTVVKSTMPSYQKLQCRLTAPYILVACDGGLHRKKMNTDDHLSMCNCSGGLSSTKQSSSGSVNIICMVHNRWLAELFSGYETGHCGRPRSTGRGLRVHSNGKLVHFIFYLWPFSS